MRLIKRGPSFEMEMTQRNGLHAMQQCPKGVQLAVSHDLWTGGIGLGLNGLPKTK